jgi:hypothetical protein
VSLFENLDTSETQQAWDARIAELEKLLAPRYNLNASFKRAQDRGVDADPASADPKHLAQLDITDGAWVDRELRGSLDTLDGALNDVRTLNAAVKTAAEELEARRQAYAASQQTLVAAKAKAKANLKRNLKWGVGLAFAVMILRTCTS